MWMAEAEGRLMAESKSQYAQSKREVLPRIELLNHAALQIMLPSACHYPGNQV